MLGGFTDPTRHARREQRRSLARRVRQGILVAALAGTGVLSVLALRPRPVPVDIAPLRRGSLVVAIEESGMTRVKDRYVVSASVTGNLSRLLLEPGDAIKEGDVLAEIAPSTSPLLDARSRGEAEARLGAALSAQGQARAQTARATAAGALAQQELARVRRLVEAGSLAQQPLEQAEFEARMRGEELASATFAEKVASEEVRLARVTLGEGERISHRHLDVLAPASGTVLRVLHKSAGVVQAGTPLVEVGDPRGLELVVDLLTTDAVRVKPGTPVTVLGWGGDQPLAGRVRQVEPSAFTRPSALGVDEQRVNVIVALTDARERWESLGDGYRVEARLVLWRADDVVKAPMGAVFRNGDGWASYVVEGGRAALVPVTLGHRGETEVEILSGPAAGTNVAVHPGDRVKNGARVEPR